MTSKSGAGWGSASTAPTAPLARGQAGAVHWMQCALFPPGRNWCFVCAARAGPGGQQSSSYSSCRLAAANQALTTASSSDQTLRLVPRGLQVSYCHIRGLAFGSSLK